MKKNVKLLIIILILAIIAFFMYKLAYKKSSKDNNTAGLEAYIKDIYGRTFLIPEFNNINKADEKWLWENVNQYVWNHDDEYHEKNEQEYGYTYDEVEKIVKKLYGDKLSKKFPKGSVSMRYDSSRNLYGPTSYSLDYYYDYKIDSIKKDGNNYIVSLYDFTISLDKFYVENQNDDAFEIFNNYDYLLNASNGTPIISVKSLDDEAFKNILDKKENLSHKTLTIEFNEAEKLYYIKSCKYEGIKDSETLANLYNKMQLTFEMHSIDYEQEDIYTQDEVIVNNFDELSSIYTEKALPTYKDEMNVLIFKDDGSVYFKAGEISIRDYLIKVEFKDIQTSTNKISCNVVRTFRESFNSLDEAYNNTYQKEDSFCIVKIDGEWKIDKFNYNNL